MPLSDNSVGDSPNGVALPVPDWRPRAVAEAFTVDARLMRDLAAGALAAGSHGLTKVGVAALRHGDGATTIARSLAECLAEQHGQRVVLVEANHRSPSLRRICGLPPGPGLPDVLAGRASLESALRASATVRRLLFLPASENRAAIAPGRALRDTVAELFLYADALVFDLAPVLPYADTALLAPEFDGTALVLRAGRTSRQDASAALQTLNQAGVKLLGAVLNRDRQRRT